MVMDEYDTQHTTQDFVRVINFYRREDIDDIVKIETENDPTLNPEEFRDALKKIKSIFDVLDYRQVTNVGIRISAGVIEKECVDKYDNFIYTSMVYQWILVQGWAGRRMIEGDNKL
jgi:hypothetical protein